jgi:uncharacterized membrane protein
MSMEAQLVVPVVSILCTGLAAGVFLGHKMGISVARHNLTPQSFVQLGQSVHRYFSRVMPILTIGAVLASILWSVLLRSEWRTVPFWLVVGAAIEMVYGVALTRAVNVPINHQLMTWSAAAPPENLEELWEPWEKAHTVRTILALSSFLLQVAALAVFASRRG